MHRPVAIIGHTLAFKFSAHPDLVAMFTKLGLQPWGRIGSGVVGLIAAALGVLAGAIISHLTAPGIEVNSFHGLLFIMALTAFAGAAVELFLGRNQLPFLGKGMNEKAPTPA